VFARPAGVSVLVSSREVPLVVLRRVDRAGVAGGGGTAGRTVTCWTLNERRCVFGDRKFRWRGLIGLIQEPVLLRERAKVVIHYGITGR
jgi:hypothetical protein